MLQGISRGISVMITCFCISETCYRKWNKGSVVSLFHFADTASFSLCGFVSTPSPTDVHRWSSIGYLLIVQGKARVGGGGGWGGGRRFQERRNSLHPERKKGTESASGSKLTCGGLSALFFNVLKSIFILLLLLFFFFFLFFWNGSASLKDMLVQVSKSISMLLCCMLLRPVSTFHHFLLMTWTWSCFQVCVTCSHDS